MRKPPHRSIASQSVITFHTYADLLPAAGGRLAPTDWKDCNVAESIAATLAADPEAIILSVSDRRGSYPAVGYAPGGLG